ncbi:hypothetical protein LIP55_12465 [[Ruminococcus] gnavus]|nr:hypothetical protein [Mediterraneibacter gnavus]
MLAGLADNERFCYFLLTFVTQNSIPNDQFPAYIWVAFLFSLSVILYLILFAGVFVDTVLDMTRERIIDFIIS